MANPYKEPPCGEGDLEEIKDLERNILNSFVEVKLRKKNKKLGDGRTHPFVLLSHGIGG